MPPNETPKIPLNETPISEAGFSLSRVTIGL
jgi:hypothetical protein